MCAPPLCADGETNLKIREVHVHLVREPGDETFQTTGRINCDLPNDKLEVFQATFELPTGQRISLGPRNMLLRGCMLRQSEWVVGVIVYAGRETKIQMNASVPPRKLSALMKFANQQTFNTVGVMLVFCLFFGIMGAILGTADTTTKAFYLGTDADAAVSFPFPSASHGCSSDDPDVRVIRLAASSRPR
jgi:phospholipid-transporting ATPase